MNRSFESEHWNNFLPKKAWYDAIDEANDLVDHDVEMDLLKYYIISKDVNIKMLFSFVFV